MLGLTIQMENISSNVPAFVNLKGAQIQDVHLSAGRTFESGNAGSGQMAGHAGIT